MKDIRNYRLLKHNTFGIDAACSRFIEFATESELMLLLRRERFAESGEPLLILGGGSNLLLTDDFGGTVLHSAIMGIEDITAFEGEAGDSVLLRVGSGVVWDDFVAYCVERGWSGAENLSLIPGEVGASAVQNIGAYGVEAKDLIERVEAVEIATGERVAFERDDCRYAYRQSRFKQDWKNRFVITYVTYRLSRTFVPRLDYGNLREYLFGQKQLEQAALTAKDVREAIIYIRRAKLPDPAELGNGGSFFMNPVVPRAKYEELAARYPNMPHYDVDAERVKIPAGWMIEQCGWKGRRLGPAGVYEKQALVLVNLGGARGEDIVGLCEAIRHDVNERFGIEILPEVNVV